MLTRYKGQLKLKDWAFPIAKRSTMCKGELLWLAASQSSCMRCCETRQCSYWPKPGNLRDRTPNRAPKRSDALREGADDGADFVARGQPMTDCDFNQADLYPAYPIKCRTSTQRTQRTQAPESLDTRRAPALDPLENKIRRLRAGGNAPESGRSRYGAVHDLGAPLSPCSSRRSSSTSASAVMSASSNAPCRSSLSLLS